MIPGESPNSTGASGLRKALLEDGEATAVFVLTVDSKVAVKIGFEEDLRGRVGR